MKRFLALLAFFAAATLAAQGSPTAYSGSISDSVISKNSGLAIPAGYFVIQDEGGAALPSWNTINCVGAGIVCSDDTPNSRTTITVAGGGGAVPTGTGFRHVTAGVEDGATKLVDTADINASQVTYAKIQNSSVGLTLFGRAANSSGVFAEIAATAASDCVFRESSSALGCGTIATAGLANSAVTYAKLQNSSVGLTVLGRSANSSGVYAEIACTAAGGGVLRESGSTLGCGTIATAGIGAAQVTLAKIANASANSRLLGSGSAGSGASYAELTSTDLTFGASTVNVANSAITNAKMANMPAWSVKVNNTSSAAAPTDPTDDITGACNLFPTDCMGWFEEFGGKGSGFGDLGGWATTAGGGAGSGNATITAAAGHPGMVWLSTGTTATNANAYLARETVASGGGNLFALSGKEMYDWLVMVPVASSATDRFLVQVGLSTIGGASSTEDVTDEMHFTYTDNVNSGKWLFKACKASACGTLDTTVTMSAGTWYHLKMVANSATSYEIFVNGTDAGAFTTTADIPTTGLHPAAKIGCTVNTAASAKVLRIDYLRFIQWGLAR